jgi:hypothetical protein
MSHARSSDGQIVGYLPILQAATDEYQALERRKHDKVQASTHTHKHLDIPDTMAIKRQIYL